MKLLTIGSVHIDQVYRVEHIARDGETIMSQSFTLHEGGKGLNQAIALAKAGACPIFAGAVGEDGRYLLDYMRSHNVDISIAKVIPGATGRTVIQVDDNGHNCIIVHGGTNRAITNAMVDEWLSGFSHGDAILLQNETSAVPYMIEAANARGMAVYLNASPIIGDMHALPLSMVSMIMINEVEGFSLTGTNEPDGIIDILRDRYPATSILLTLGEHGAIYADVTIRINQPAIPAQAVDTTGAGDTFTGYFISAIHAGGAVKDALKIAAHAAAIAVSRPGAGQSIPTPSEVAASMNT